MKKIEIQNMETVMKLFGKFDENIDYIKKHFGLHISLVQNYIEIDGTIEQEEKCFVAIKKLLELIEKGEFVDKGRIRYIVGLAENGNADDIDEAISKVVAVTSKGKPIKCRTLGQKKYVDLLNKKTVVFGVGPAGTGKTYLAVCHAVSCLKRGEIERIVLTRPAVEAGEKLGFLPGDLQEKVDPYLRPLYDALSEMLGTEQFVKMQERGIIEVAPLAYMRGRTLPHSYIILDEAQNTTSEQMKMFLTRIGENSKMVITGDITQIDLPGDKRSGLKMAIKILSDIDDIAVMHLSSKDVVRHELIQKIVNAYEKADKKIIENKKEEKH